MTLAIPNEQTITVEWFNRCFERCGIDATVSGFDAERVGTGQIGKCIRYTQIRIRSQRCANQFGWEVSVR